MANDDQTTGAVLQELKHIKKLLISMLIVSGVEAKTIAKILNYKQVSSISNEIPVRELQKLVRLQETSHQ